MKDISVKESFSKLDENKNYEKYEEFELKLEIGKIKHYFLKKEILIKINEERYYDITTPHSYGGPMIFDCQEDDKWELVDEFQRAFQTYCEENMIVCESVMFHPRLLNVFDFISIYAVECEGIESRSETTWSYGVLESYKLSEIVFYKEETDRILESNICVGKKIWNEEVYKRICEAVEIGVDADYFPAYRLKEEHPNLLETSK